MRRVVGAFSVLLVACPSGPAKDPVTYVFGAAMAQTGGSAGGGVGYIKSLQVAEKEINDAGGFLDGTVRLEVLDDKSTGPGSLEAVTTLLTNFQVPVIFGPTSSDGVLAVIETAKTIPVLMLSGSANAPEITPADDGDFVFRSGDNSRDQAVTMVEHVYSKGHRKIAILYVNSSHGKGLYPLVKEALQAKSGVTISAEAMFANDNMDKNAVIDTVFATSPEAIILIGHQVSGAQVLKDWSVTPGRYSGKWFLTNGMRSSDVASLAGATVVEGIEGTSLGAWGETESPNYGVFAEAHKALFEGALPGPGAAGPHYYDNFILAALAAEKAKSADAPAMRDALRSVANAPGEEVGPGEFKRAIELIRAGTEINYQGASGPIELDDKGDNKVIYIDIWAFQAGKTVRLDTKKYSAL